MIFAAPTPFAEAAASHEVRALLPTALSSAELEQLGQDVLRRAMFAARMDNANDLQLIKNLVGQIIDGKLDHATARLRIQEALDARGYEAPSVDEEDTITDLRSEKRIDLILQTNVQMAQGYGSWLQGQDQAILDHWPAQELYRQEGRRVPRDWPVRWQEAGGRFAPGQGVMGRMIALKNDGIWVAISRFGNPYPPFDFNSGMNVRDITRREAIGLGLIDATTRIAPQTRPFNDGLKASVAGLDDDVRAELENEGYEVQGGDISLGPTGGLEGH